MNERSTKRIPRSSTRSRAYLARSARPCSVMSHPTWACSSPRTAPLIPAPAPTWGECGSPSSSVWAWCLRWSATQLMTGPWTAIEPAAAKKYSTGLEVLNERWVSIR